MKDKKLVAGIAIGAAVLAVAGIILYKKKKSKKEKFLDYAEDAADRYRGKLKNLRRKAGKEYQHLVEDGEDLAQAAKDRVQEFANRVRMQ